MDNTTKLSSKEELYRQFLECLLDIFAAHECITTKRCLQTKRSQQELPVMTSNVKKIHRQLKELVYYWRDVNINNYLGEIELIISKVEKNLLWLLNERYLSDITFIQSSPYYSYADKAREAYSFCRQIKKCEQYINNNSLCDDKIAQLGLIVKDMNSIISGRYRIDYSSAYAHLKEWCDCLKHNVEYLTKIIPVLRQNIVTEPLILNSLEQSEWLRENGNDKTFIFLFDNDLNLFLSYLRENKILDFIPSLNCDMNELKSNIYAHIFLPLYDLSRHLYHIQVQDWKNYPTIICN